MDVRYDLVANCQVSTNNSVSQTTARVSPQPTELELLVRGMLIRGFRTMSCGDLPLFPFQMNSGGRWDRVYIVDIQYIYIL